MCAVVSVRCQEKVKNPPACGDGDYRIESTDGFAD